MSSSNLAVSMDYTATDQLSQPPRPALSLVSSNEHPVKIVRIRPSLSHRKFVIRDQGFRLFRVR